MAFSVDSADIAKLDYDFSPLTRARGRSPEPSPDQVRKFQLKIKNTATLLGKEDLDVNDSKAMQRFVDGLDEEQMAEIDEQLFRALADLLSNRPTFEEMMELYNISYRYGQEYARQTIEDVLDPKRGNRDI